MALSALVLAAAAYALQPTGTHHGDEALARDGQAWLALQESGGRAALVATRVRVTPVNDAIVDGPGEATGREVAAGVPDTRVLLRGPGLRAGAVATVDVPQAPRPIAQGPLDLRLSGRSYRLALDCRAAAIATQRCKVVLVDGRRRQALFDIEASVQPDASRMLGDDATPTLWFAGDLDRDGRLDLILDTTDHYNLGRPTLFLSSKAKPGELVRPVAVHESTGC